MGVERCVPTILRLPAHSIAGVPEVWQSTRRYLYRALIRIGLQWWGLRSPWGPDDFVVGEYPPGRSGGYRLICLDAMRVTATLMTRFHSRTRISSPIRRQFDRDPAADVGFCVNSLPIVVASRATSDDALLVDCPFCLLGRQPAGFGPIGYYGAVGDMVSWIESARHVGKIGGPVYFVWHLQKLRHRA